VSDGEERESGSEQYSRSCDEFHAGSFLVLATSSYDQEYLRKEYLKKAPAFESGRYKSKKPSSTRNPERLNTRY
jgi:hypothetical protein